MLRSTWILRRISIVLIDNQRRNRVIYQLMPADFGWFGIRKRRMLGK